MCDYLCIRPCGFGREKFNAGDTIPAEKILPQRIPALTKQGYISPIEGTTSQYGEIQPQNTGFQSESINIPIYTDDGEFELSIEANDLIAVTGMLQQTAAETQKTIGYIVDMDILILINALDSRKTVKDAAKARHDALKKSESTQDEGSGDE